MTSPFDNQHLPESGVTFTLENFRSALTSVLERVNAARRLLIIVFRGDIIIPFTPVRTQQGNRLHPSYLPPVAASRRIKETDSSNAAEASARRDFFDGGVLEKMAKLDEVIEKNKNFKKLVSKDHGIRTFEELGKQANDLADMGTLVMLYTVINKILVPFISTGCFTPETLKMHLKLLTPNGYDYTPDLDAFSGLKTDKFEQMEKLQRHKSPTWNVTKLSKESLCDKEGKLNNLFIGLNMMLNRLAYENFSRVLEKSGQPGHTDDPNMACAGKDAAHYIKILQQYLTKRAEALSMIHGKRLDRHLFDLHEKNEVPTFVLELYCRSLLVGHAAGFSHDTAGMALSLNNLKEFGITQEEIEHPFDPQIPKVAQSIGSLLTSRQRHRYATSRLVHFIEDSEH